MRYFKIIYVMLALTLLASTAKADKGMYLINQLKQENIQRMKELGLKLSPEQIYSENGKSLSSAVVVFDNGCTGITVSKQGLIFTNHHCGYRSIQSQSSVEHDYLRDGFVARNYSEELPIPYLQVKYLKEFIDVTPQVMAAAAGIEDEMQRIIAQQEVMKDLEAPYKDLKNVEARVYPFYERNAFFLVVYDVFNDVRMVLAPPTSMGKFGADSDNWMWPRHTNDFSVFRVYANENNEPAEFSEKNRPYQPKHFAKISLRGVKEGDYSMTIGFPGSTDRYLSSWGVVNRMENENEPRILVRGLKQDVWMKHMEADQAIRIQYSNKYANSSNYWKNSIGMNKGLKALNVIDNKRAIEKRFAKWVSEDEARTQKYGNVLKELQASIENSGALNYDRTILVEALSGTEFARFVAKPSKDIMAFNADALYKDFSPVVGRATLPVMLKVVKDKVKPENLPTIYQLIAEKYDDNFEKFADYVYSNSIVLSKTAMLEALKNYVAFEKAHETDPAVVVFNSFREKINSINEQLENNEWSELKNRRLFFAGLQEMSDEYLPSDANFTMRLSYGKVGGYKPYDGAYYNYFTTEDGVLQKQDPESSEYYVQPELLKMFREKDFGQYADKDGKLHLNFISNNDITGGNSGSPVFDGEGNVIGLAFDGNWEAMSGDIEFEPNLQRCINDDIRYVIWAIDKYAGAKNIMQELEFVR